MIIENACPVCGYEMEAPLRTIEFAHRAEPSLEFTT